MQILIPKSAFTNWSMVRKRDIAIFLYFSSMILVYFASLAPWFLWSIFNVYPILVSIPIIFSVLLSRKLSEPLFNADKWIYPTITCVVYNLIIVATNGGNVKVYIFQFFHIIILASLFLLNKDVLRQLGLVLSKIMGGWLIISMAFFLLYLIGFPLPHYPLSSTQLDYSFENYRFFLLDDRSLFLIIPRFHSVFLEPSHMAMACIPLLLTQVGQWKKWWNISMLIATIISFSLAGYVFLVFSLFAIAWMQRKAILGKVLILISVVAIITVIGVTYNEGDNLFNQLIVQRLSINDDGKLSGDNRVSASFDTEYEHFTHTSDLLWGRGFAAMQRMSSGNAGYKVFIFSHGLISVLFLLIFLGAIAHSTPYKRQAVVFLVFQALSFIPHGVPTKYCMFIPLYIMLFTPIADGSLTKDSR